MRLVLADPELASFSSAGAAMEWVGAYSDYFFLPRKHLLGNGGRRLQACLELTFKHRVFFEVAIPTCLHVCTKPVVNGPLPIMYQPHKYVVLWGDQRSVVTPAFVKDAMLTSLIVHPVKLRVMGADGIAVLDAFMDEQREQVAKGA